MPGIYSVMDISRWALHANTRHLDVISHNVANVNTEGYSRQQAVQTTRWPERTPEGWYGHGTRIVNVVQFLDQLLTERLTDKQGEQEYYQAFVSQLQRLEALANEAGDTGLGQEITAFFNAWQDVSNNPQSSAVRQVLVETTKNLISRFQVLMKDLTQIKRDLNTYIAGSVEEANSLIRRIAELNKLIMAGEVGGKKANDLRDSRRQALNELAGILNISWFEDNLGMVTVIAGKGKTLVQADYPDNNDPDPLEFGPVNGYTESQVTWRDQGLVMGLEEITTGRLGAWIKVRDQDVTGMQTFLNDLSIALIANVNQLHSQGAGQEKFTSVTGTYQISDVTNTFANLAAMANTKASNSSPLTVIPDHQLEMVQDGSFDIWVYEAGARRKYTVDVYRNDSLNSLINRINTVLHNGAVTSTQNPVASMAEGGNIVFSATAGMEFTFANDTSHVLAGLGVNTFFDGYSATSLGLNPFVTANVNMVNAGRILSNGEHALGDNTNALDIADLKDEDLMSNHTETMNEAIVSWASGLGAKINGAEDGLAFSETAHNDLKDLRDSTSAVSLDEEMVNMIRYQRSYQVAARMVSVADTLLATLLEMKR